MIPFLGNFVRSDGRWAPFGSCLEQGLSVYYRMPDNTWSVYCMCISMEGHHRHCNLSGLWFQTGMDSCDLKHIGTCM